MGATAPPVAAKVTDFQQIENRLNEAIDMLRNVGQTALAIKNKLIGDDPSEVAIKTDQPPSSTFVARVNVSIDIIHGVLRETSATLDELNDQI